MRNTTIATILLCLAGLTAVGYQADGGLFRRKDKCSPNVERPDKPFPIDELFGPIIDDEVAPCVGSTCPATLDIDAIVKEVIERLPPVKMEIHHPDGKVYTQSKPLGEPIRLVLVPQ